jgi:hypothetical protein
MNKPVIRSYEDLLLEKERLRFQLNTQKTELNGRIQGLKEKLAPVATILSVIGGITAMSPKNPMVNTGVGIAVDMFLKKKLFKNSGLITGVLSSFLLRNVATKLVGGVAGALIGKAISKFVKRKKTPKAPTTATPG